MSNAYTTIRVDRRGHVAEVVLNRPDKLNAMTIKFFHEIKARSKQIDLDPSVRAVVVWAEGRMFTAGLDLKEAATGVLGGGARQRQRAQPRGTQLPALPHDSRAAGLLHCDRTTAESR